MTTYNWKWGAEGGGGFILINRIVGFVRVFRTSHFFLMTTRNWFVYLFRFWNFFFFMWLIFYDKRFFVNIVFEKLYHPCCFVRKIF